MAKCIIALTVAVLSCAAAKPTAESYAQGFGYTHNPEQSALVATPAVLYHAQDEDGQYRFGYSSDLSSREESKTADGVVRGSYSYVDANGKRQEVKYISDVLGFRTVPEHTEVEPVGYTQAAVQAVPSVIAPTVAYTYLPYAINYGYTFHPVQLKKSSEPTESIVEVAQAAAPTRPEYDVVVTYADPASPTPLQEPQPAVVTKVQAPLTHPAGQYLTQSQYHAQDEHGQYEFGYTDPNSARAEVKTADGVVRGSYNYVDDAGKIQTVQYIADSQGFRTYGTNAPIQTYDLPQPVEDTAEVKAARAEHQRLVAAAKASEGQLPVNTYRHPGPVQETAEVAAARAQHERIFAEIQTRDEELRTLPKQLQVEPVAPAAQVQVAKSPVVPAVGNEGVALPAVHQYHAQDDAGQYQYGYTNADSFKTEQRLADGTVTGAYSYVDAEGQLQTVQYISDALGFRVGGTNLPVHRLPEASSSSAESTATAVITPQVSYSYLPYAVNYGYYQSPLVPTTTSSSAAHHEKAIPPQQGNGLETYHAQDQLGQYHFGYSGPLSSKQESKSSDGVVRGAYSYLDANGKVQSVSYISDVLGFRAVGTNFPGAGGGSAMAVKTAYSHLPYAIKYPYYY